MAEYVEVVQQGNAIGLEDLLMTAKINSTKTNICEEVPVDLFLNGRKMLTFMCTPENLKELAAGYLYSRRLISKLDDIQTLAACEDMRKMYVKIKGDIPETEFSLSRVLSSGCGNGVPYDENVLLSIKNNSEFTIGIDKLKELSIEMFSKAILYKTMGGLHCSCLADDKAILALKEDIGRHNAVDKVVGKGLFLGLDFTNMVILTTGRISSDMLLKAAVSGFPIVGSRSIPSNLAVDMAEKMGVTLVGRVMMSNPIVYTHSHRIKGYVEAGDDEC